MTQEDAAKEYGTTPVTIRGWTETAWEYHTDSDWPTQPPEPEQDQDGDRLHTSEAL